MSDPTAGMNRKQKRGFLRRGGNKPQRFEERYLPKPLDEFTIFGIIQTLLDNMASGDLPYKEGEGYMVEGLNGDKLTATGMLAGWLYTWMKIKHHEKAEFDLQPLVVIEHRLKKETLIKKKELAEARDCLFNLRLYFRQMDRVLLTKMARIAAQDIKEGKLRDFTP